MSYTDQISVPARVLRPAVFFDRDGVLNRDYGFVHRIADLTWCDGAIAAVRQLNQVGYLVFVVTNQSGIARGYYDELSVQAFHAEMQRQLGAEGAHIDEFVYCPHHPEGQDARYAIHCRCRKPAPGMIESLMERWPVDRAQSFLIGDRESDLQAAKAAKISGYLFNNNKLDEYINNILNNKLFV